MGICRQIFLSARVCTPPIPSFFPFLRNTTFSLYYSNGTSVSSSIFFLELDARSIIRRTKITDKR